MTNNAMNSLENINSWDDVSDDVDLFDQLNDSEPVENDNTQQEEETKSEASEPVEQENVDNHSTDPQSVESEEKKEEDLFDPNADVANETEEVESSNNQDGQSRSVYQYLLDNAFIESGSDFDIDKASDEDIEDYIQDRLDAVVDANVHEMLGELPDFVKDLNKYVLNGGDWNTFIDHYKNSNFDASEMDIDDEDVQKSIVTQYFKSQGFDDEYIGLQLEFLTENGKLKDVAKKQYDNIQSNIKAEQERALKEQEERIAQLKEQEKEYKRSLNKFVKQTDNIGDLLLTKDDKRTLSNYVSDRNVKLTNGTYITEMQKELYYDIPQNQEAMLQLALLLRNRNEDGTFNFDNIKKQVETKITKNIKDNMRRNKSGRPDDTKVGRQSSRRSLADYFD